MVAIPRNQQNQVRIPNAALATIESLTAWCIEVQKAIYTDKNDKETKGAVSNTRRIQRTIVEDDDNEDRFVGRVSYKLEGDWSGDLGSTGTNATTPLWQNVKEIDTGTAIPARYLVP
jgi:hypothetical protein